MTPEIEPLTCSCDPKEHGGCEAHLRGTPELCNARPRPEKDLLTVRVTTTGVVVVEGPCPHCDHDAAEHWSSGCKGGRGDHCRMDPRKLARAALCLQDSGCDGYSHSLLCNNAYFAAIRPPVSTPGQSGPTP